VKKLVRVKTRQPMILIDTPCVVFDKFVWTLEMRMYVFGQYPLKSEHVHSHYTRPPN